MTYSSACFDDQDIPLIEAQQKKYQRIIDSLNLQQGEKILEVGCGWGGLMEAATLQGIDIDCLTISQEQAKYAKDRANRLSTGTTQGQAEILIQDYRDHHRQYDGIASIEMFEAVGEAYWPSYFAMIDRCLKPGKKACIQTIVIADELFDKYRNSSDFIQQYVFPGGMLPSIEKFKLAAKKQGLIVESIHSFGQDYQKTLCLWHEKFNQQLDQVKAQGFDQRFIRLWNLYLMYCAAGFAEKSTDVIQFTLSKPH
jgi:cyclopropane-fatty-acyl-phospholipid synthase